MHSTEIDGVTIHHNGDFSGDVLIVVDKTNTEEYNSTGSRVMVEVSIPFKILRSLVIEQLRRKTISNFESMSDEDFVDWATAGWDGGVATTKYDPGLDDISSIQPNSIGITNSFYH